MSKRRQRDNIKIIKSQKDDNLSIPERDNNITSKRKRLMGDKLFYTCNSGGKITEKDLEDQLKNLKRQRCISKDCDLEALRNACKLKSTLYGEKQEELKTLFNIASALNDLSTLILSLNLGYDFMFFPYTFECLDRVYKIVDVQLINYDLKDLTKFFTDFKSFIEAQKVMQPFIIIFSYVDVLGRKQVIDINYDVIKNEKEYLSQNNCIDGLQQKIDNIVQNQSICFKAILDAYQNLKRNGKELESIIDEAKLANTHKTKMFSELEFLSSDLKEGIINYLFDQNEFSIDINVTLDPKNWQQVMSFLKSNEIVDEIKDNKDFKYKLRTNGEDYTWDENEKSMVFFNKNISVIKQINDLEINEDIVSSTKLGTTKYILARTLSIPKTRSFFRYTSNERELSAEHAGAFIVTPNAMYSVGYGYSDTFNKKDVVYDDKSSFSFINFLRKNSVLMSLQSIETSIPFGGRFGLPSNAIGEEIKKYINEGFVGALYTPDYYFDNKLDISLSKRENVNVDFRFVDVIDHGTFNDRHLERLKNWLKGSVKAMTIKFELLWKYKENGTATKQPDDLVKSNISSMNLEDTFTLRITKQYILEYEKKAYAGLVSTLPEASLCSVNNPANCSSFLESIFREEITCMHEWFQFSYPGSCRRKDKKIVDCKNLGVKSDFLNNFKDRFIL